MKAKIRHVSIIALISFSAVCATAEVKEVKEITDALKARIMPAEAKFLAHDAILHQLNAADKSADDAWRSLKSRAEYDAHRSRIRERYIEAIGGLNFKRTPLNAKVTEKIARDGYSIEKILFESRPGV